MLAACTLLLGVFLPLTTLATPPGVSSADRARVNYMLNCQGCHGPDGTGTADGVVPAMDDFVGQFLKVEGGRRFLVQVPGSANAAVSNEQLAELLNWMLFEISPAQVPQEFVPYSAEEVATYRAQPLVNVEEVREGLIEAIDRL